MNEVICHGIPDMRPFENGDIVNLDVTVYYKGHHADLNETYFVGDIDEESVKLVETAYACLAAAVEIGQWCPRASSCCFHPRSVLPPADITSGKGLALLLPSAVATTAGVSRGCA